MIIIDVNDLDKYRYAVAKLAFLDEYKDYELVENYPNSNCFLAKIDNDKVIVSLLGKPQIRKTNYKTIIFRQKASDDSQKLTKSFNILFDKYLIQMLISPIQLINDKEDKRLFEEFLIDIYSAHSLDGVIYKHYSCLTDKENHYNRTDGDITFVHPNTFNDPFDCSYIASDSDFLDTFRIFCTIPVNDNILMWSYYSNDHKGYCFEYKKFEIIKVLLNENIDGIVLYGKVKYRNERPSTLPKTKNVTYSNIKFYIDTAFRKAHFWSHEKEFRFLIVSDVFRKMGQYLNFNIPVEKVFVGCKGDTEPIKGKTKIIKPIAMEKSKVNYKLEYME